jgi:hypothetical protein
VVDKRATGVVDDKRLCLHRVVTRGMLEGMPIWTCERCADQFVHQDVLEQLERETNGAIDMSCAMFARIIVDACRQMGAQPPSFADDTPVDPATCEHEWGEDDHCIRCGVGRFLGG